MTIRQHLTALHETARCLALIRIANAGAALTAWANTRDLDRDWDDLNYELARDHEGH